jgi:hypothetical protein
MNKRRHEDMVASLFAASIQEDDGIEASLLQTVAATLAVLESNDKEEKKFKFFYIGRIYSISQ